MTESDLLKKLQEHQDRIDALEQDVAHLLVLTEHAQNQHSSRRYSMARNSLMNRFRKITGKDYYQ